LSRKSGFVEITGGRVKVFIPFEAAETTNVTNRASVGRFKLAHDGRAEAIDRRRVEQDLRQALEEQQFKLYYQPRLSLATGEQVGAEALLRWPHRKRGLISAAGFIAIAERSDLITRIGEWVARTGCSEAAGWPDNLVVSMNISPRQLESGELVDLVGEALQVSGLPPDRLELEISETMALGIGIDGLMTLSALRDRGVGLALDDFGSCHASLAMLKRLPLTVLKIDRSLVREVACDPEDAAIVAACVVAAHGLGIVVVAEGVETEQQRGLLAALGCDDAQGHLFSQALSAAQMRERMCVGDG
jgi:EAL domain-containing protein (putative c-di-GMP-specific phosphodiesterase class I)